MLRPILAFLICSLTIPAFNQSAEALAQAWKRFTDDPQLKYAVSSLLIVDAETGRTMLARNEKLGLAPASTLKILTAATVLDLLKPDYRYRTEVSTTGTLQGRILKGDLVVRCSGDPALGSWRYPETRYAKQMADLVVALQSAGIDSISGGLQIIEEGFGTQLMPGGWTFEDMGNYYGAGAGGLNWYENQYDLVLRPGPAEGDAVVIAGTKPVAGAVDLRNELKAGPRGSGDNAVIYPDRWPNGTVRGTVPAGAREFIISGSVPDPAGYFQKALRQFGDSVKLPALRSLTISAALKSDAATRPLITWVSPRLDTLTMQFLKRSINLYGEAFIKTMAREKGLQGTTEEGVKLLRDYWKQRGIDPAALKLKDGSGLAPQNRVTTEALVAVLQYARRQSWYPAFYEGLPVINGIRMKSGTIGGAKGYAGYITDKQGKNYSFAFLVNNYDGSANAVVQKMWKVLDVLAK